MKSHRLLITVTEQEHRLIARAAKAEGERLGLRIPVATYIRRAAVMAAKYGFRVERMATASVEAARKVTR